MFLEGSFVNVDFAHCTNPRCKSRAGWRVLWYRDSEHVEGMVRRMCVLTPSFLGEFRTMWFVLGGLWLQEDACLF